MDYKHKLMTNVFDLYNEYKQMSNNKYTDHHSMINLVIKSSITFDNTHKIFQTFLWDDIEKILYKEKQNNLSYPLLIKCCINANKFDKGKELISNLRLSTMDDPYIKTTLIDFYGHFGEIINAKIIFDSITENRKDAVCIGSMMKVFIDNDYIDNALQLYDKYDNITNEVCDLLAIKACIKIHDLEKGKQIHEMIEKNNKYQSISLKATLIDFYGIFGDIDTAIKIFDSIDKNNIDIWCIGAMMESFYINKYYQQCFQLFENIKLYKQNGNKPIRPNLACYSIIFKNCTQTTSYYIGHKIHEQLKIDKYSNWILKDIQIQTKLIHFYGKCGKTEKCQEIFDEIQQKQYKFYVQDIGIWNAMITAYGRNGELDKIKDLYSKLKKLNIIDRKSYILLINACSHCNDIQFAKIIWQNDIENDKIKYDSFVVTSIIDCFSRKGLIKQGRDIINKYESFKNNKVNDNDKTMWLSLLSGCRNSGDPHLADSIYAEMKARFKI